MNTKLLMTASALVMGVVGIFLSFAPLEIRNYLGSAPGTPADGIILQIVGALYFAFAMVNWTAKANLIGGIYSRPIAIGNLTHFTIGALALMKGYSLVPEPMMIVFVFIYSLFAILFTIVFFRHPVRN